jgi:uncharacterized protein YlxP (DUF503 family)
MVVGVCRLTLLMPESHSLKQKRMVLRRIKDRTRQKFNLAIAEVALNDQWQSAQLGFAVLANERRFVETMVARICSFVEAMALAKIADEEKDFITYGEAEGLGGGEQFPGWSAEEDEQLLEQWERAERAEREEVSSVEGDGSEGGGESRQIVDRW